MNIYKKLLEVKKSVEYLRKTKQGEVKYAYVSSSDVLIAIRKSMEAQKLLLIPNVLGHSFTEIVRKEGQSTTILTELDIEYTWVNVENPEETLKNTWYGQGVDISGEKGVGKALTYAEKYYFLKFFNIPTDKDDPDVVVNKAKKTPQSAKTDNNVQDLQKFIGLKEKDVLKNAIGAADFAKEMNACNTKMIFERYYELLGNSEQPQTGIF